MFSKLQENVSLGSGVAEDFETLSMFKVEKLKEFVEP